MRFELNVATSYEVIVVRRSSTHPPSQWGSGTGSLLDGLPIWGQSMVRSLVAWQGYDLGLVVLHTCYEVATRHLPLTDMAFVDAEPNINRRGNLRRAYYFTESITADIETANAAGVTSILYSIGLDGWACDAKMILPWLRNLRGSFSLVIRAPALHYGMVEDLLRLRPRTSVDNLPLGHNSPIS